MNRRQKLVNDVAFTIPCSIQLIALVKQNTADDGTKVGVYVYRYMQKGQVLPTHSAN